MNDIKKVQAEYEDFFKQLKSVIISTANEQGVPNASYAPFVSDEHKNIYIYISALSIHTQNMFVNPRVSVMLIEDENKTEQIFARRRLIFDCIAIPVERETNAWQEIIFQFQARFGEIIDILRNLTDFHVFQLTPQKGRFITGFGAAYSLSGENLNQLQHLTANS
jgi:putative heme iron utilization protein